MNILRMINKDENGNEKTKKKEEEDDDDDDDDDDGGDSCETALSTASACFSLFRNFYDPNDSFGSGKTHLTDWEDHGTRKAHLGSRGPRKRWRADDDLQIFDNMKIQTRVASTGTNWIKRLGK